MATHGDRGSHGQTKAPYLGFIDTKVRMDHVKQSRTRLSEYLMEELGINAKNIAQIINLLEYCKVGNFSIGETIRIKENCE